MQKLHTYTPDYFDELFNNHSDYNFFFQDKEDVVLKFDREPMNTNEWGLIDNHLYSYQALKDLDLYSDTTIVSEVHQTKPIKVYGWADVEEDSLKFEKEVTPLELLQFDHDSFLKHLQDYFLRMIDSGTDEVIEIDIRCNPDNNETMIIVPQYWTSDID